MIEPSLSIYLPWRGEEKDNRLALQWSPLVRLTFGPTKIFLASVPTLKARYSLALAYTDKKFDLEAKNNSYLWPLQAGFVGTRYAPPHLF